VLVLTGCSTTKEPDVVDNQLNNNTIDSTGDAAEPVVDDGVDVEKLSGYYFTYEDIIIRPHAEAASILEALGEPKNYFEAESCAYQGMDRIYTYNGFEITTYEIDGVEFISMITFIDDTVETTEGVYLFQTIDEAIAVYGEDYTQNFDMYIYEDDNVQLSFITEDDKIISIEYFGMIEQ